MPRILWIIEILSLEVHSAIILAKDEEVKGLYWSHRNDLFFGWGKPSFGLWNPEQISAFNPPFSKDLDVYSLVGTPDKTAILIKGNKSCCFFYPDSAVTKKGRQERLTHQNEPASNPHDISSQSLKRVSLDTSMRKTDRMTDELIDDYDNRRIRDSKDGQGFNSIDTFGDQNEQNYGRGGNNNYGGHRFE